MAKGKADSEIDQEEVAGIVTPPEKEIPVSTLVAQRGIRTSADFADFMGALMCDLVQGSIQPEVAKAACLAGDKLLAIAKMQLEYGRTDKGKPNVLCLGDGDGK